MLNKKKIKVCGNCLRACCYQGIFMCDNWQSANVIEKTIAELKQLNLENFCYWDDEELSYEKIFGKKCEIDFDRYGTPN